MSAAGQRQVWLKPAVAIALVVVSAFSLLGLVVLSAYAPDLETESDGGTHALSTSAIGFAGIVRLLQYENVPAIVDRGYLKSDREGGSLVVITPGAFGDPTKLAAIASGRPRLIILPKWLAMPDPVVQGWVRKIGPLDEQSVVDVALKTLAPKSTITRRKGVSPVNLRITGDVDDFDVPDRIGPVDSLQVISGKDWVPLIVDGKGGAILAQLRGKETYVLADPDLMNTQGLKDLPTARAAIGILEGLRTSDGAILFDVTLNGYGRSPSLLRAAFAPPFLGATLCALAVAALMALHALARFGAPLRVVQAFKSGKEALVDNSALLIHMMRREPHMTSRYATTSRNMAARAVGLPKGLGSDDADALLDRLAHANGDAPSLKQLFADAAAARTTAEMMDVAAQLYAWRRGLTHERD